MFLYRLILGYLVCCHQFLNYLCNVHHNQSLSYFVIQSIIGQNIEKSTSDNKHTSMVIQNKVSIEYILH